MRTSTGQILRAAGLLIELLGVIAVLAQSRINEAGWFPLLGGSVPLGWIAVAAGFVMWLAGRIVLATSDRRSMNQKPAEPLD
jgi:hypothetical protein